MSPGQASPKIALSILRDQIDRDQLPPPGWRSIILELISRCEAAEGGHWSDEKVAEVAIVTELMAAQVAAQHADRGSGGLDLRDSSLLAIWKSKDKPPKNSDLRDNALQVLENARAIANLILAGSDEEDEDRLILWAHLVSEHATMLPIDAGIDELADQHEHEHCGPGTIRDHDPAARNYSLKKIGLVLAESET